MHGDKETLRVCVRKASNPKSRREIYHHRKPSGNRLFFKIFKRERDVEVVGGGDVGGCGRHGDKATLRVCV